ncbi:MAG: zinc-dependent metalloprotease [Actinomycetota bacterium]
MSGNLPFGFGAPDGGQPPFDMSQLGAMLQQLGRLMQQGGTEGGVSWDLARDGARQAISGQGDPSVSQAQRQAVVEAISLAQVWLDPATSFPASSAEGMAWSRSEWLEGTFPAWQRIVGPIAEHVQTVMAAGEGEAMPPEIAAILPEGLPPEAAAMIAPLMAMARQMGAAMFGMQVGQALAALSTEVVGAADVGVPLTTDARPVLVPRNVEQFGDGLGIPVDEVRLYLALRECAHQRLFAHVPWLPARLEGAIDGYARGIRVDSDRLGEAMRSIDPASLQDPARLQEALGSDMFALAESPEQQAALARLETLLALIEGWVSDVVSQASSATLPSSERMEEAVRRRRAAGGPAERTFASLVGLELRPRALREAEQLWRLLRQSRGIEGRDALWGHPDLLPDAEDLRDPQGFLDRTSGEPLTGPEPDAP